ncbi:PapB/FocB family fimbrial expression transcriptional regulator [Escherichia coli]|nr:PapB/FocB family fimbrial expression transcriptional regulator [Escherichia coli]
MELSAIHSQKIINALRDYLVSGDTRKVSCERHGANISYFSIALGRLFRVSQLVSQLTPYYCEENFIPDEKEPPRSLMLFLSQEVL